MTTANCNSSVRNLWLHVGLFTWLSLFSFQQLQGQDTAEADRPAESDNLQQQLAKSYPSLRDLDTHCPFTPPASAEAWKERSAQVKQQLLVTLGLWPMPKLEPVQPKIYGRITLDGYTIEKATFESLPGFFVTGNLYRPDPMPSGKLPGILCAHGHWLEARFYDESPEQRNKLLAIGAERFDNAARNHIQASCVHLARMGCVVFQWDMIGYCDNTQISFDRAHKFANQSKETEVADDGWLLFSPQAEAHAQSIMGLQTLNGIRGVDFLATLPEIDMARIGITGASGGGTQSFITAAIDPRIAVAFPAVMVSTGMQGGCTCENACGLRTGTGNVEVAGLIAPRPLGMTAANDWTRTMPSDGFPQLKDLYARMGAKDNVALFPAIHFDHNYNHVARTSMYGWMNKHFKLGFIEPVLERDFVWKGKDDLHVWDADHPQPPSGEEFERRLMKSFRDNIDVQYADLQAQGKADQLRETLKQGWQVCLGLTTGPIAAASVSSSEGELTTLTSTSDGQWQVRSGKVPAGQLSLRVDTGKGNSGGDSISYSFAWLGQNFVESGATVELAQQPLVANPRLSAAYTYGYNQPLFAHRARQLAATLTWLATKHPGSSLTIQGQGHQAALAAAGVFCVESAKGSSLRLRLAPGGFRFDKVDSIRDPNFLPGAARYRDLPGLFSCLASQTEIVDNDSL